MTRPGGNLSKLMLLLMCKLYRRVMKLTELTKKTRKIIVTYLGESAEVEYRLAVVTPGFLSELKGLNGTDSVIHQLEKIVIRWDVTDENGHEIPPTEEQIRKYDIPVRFLSAVIRAVSDDMDGWEKAEKKG